MKPMPGLQPLGEAWKKKAAIDTLRATIQEQLLTSPVITDALEACDLQPTTRAAWLAADSALNVILAHELGQEVAEDAARDEAEDEGFRRDELPLTFSIGDQLCACGHAKREHADSLDPDDFICAEPSCRCTKFVESPF